MRKELGTFVLLVALCVVVAAINPAFLGGANLQNMARLIGMYGIFSIGLGVVIITGGIDLSVGSVFALLGVLLSIMLVEWHMPGALARFIANDETKGFGTGQGFEWLTALATGSLFGVPAPFVLLVFVAAVMWVVLHRSVYGRYLFAVGRNEEVAPVDRAVQHDPH